MTPLYFFWVLSLVELSTASWATMTMPSARPAGTRLLEGRVLVGIARRGHGVLHVDEAVHQAKGPGGAVEGVQALRR